MDMMSWPNATPRQENTALVLYGLTLMAAPWTTVSMVWTGGPEAPFLHGAMLRAGATTAFLLTLAAILGQTAWQHRHVLMKHRRTLISWGLTALIFNTTDLAMLNVAMAHADPAVVLIVMEMHPVPTILISLWLDRKGQRLRREAGKLLLLLAPACAAGVILLSAAEAGGVSELVSHGNKLWPDLPIGYGAAAACMLSVSITAVSVQWAVRTGLKVTEETDEKLNARTAACIALAAIMAAAGIIGVPLNAAIGLATGERLNPANAAMGFALAGMGVTTMSTITWRSALLLTDRVNLITVFYLVPLTALGLQWLSGISEVKRPEYVLLAMILIVGSNAALHLRGRSRPVPPVEPTQPY